MILFCYKGFQNAHNHFLINRCENSGYPGRFPVCMSEIQGRAEGIHLILAFPHMVIIFCFILVSRTVRPLVECIRIRVQADKFRLFGDDSLNDIPKLPVLCRILYIGPHLSRGVSQPHGGNISRDHKIAAVLQLLYRGFHGVQKTTGRQRGQRFILNLIVFFQLFCLIYKN